MRIWIWKRSLFWNTLGIELCSFRSFILFYTFRVVLNRAVIWKILLLAFWCLVVTKRSHILEQNCGWNLQVCLSRRDLFVTTRHWRVKFLKTMTKTSLFWLIYFSLLTNYLNYVASDQDLVLLGWLRKSSNKN